METLAMEAAPPISILTPRTFSRTPPRKPDEFVRAYAPAGDDTPPVGLCEAPIPIGTGDGRVTFAPTPAPLSR